ncbi:hypothetical protein EV182_006942, partial [Spiromyces aspiralis]
GISASERGHQASQRASARARGEGSRRLASAEARAAKEPAALTGTPRVGSEAVPKAKSVRPNGGVADSRSGPSLALMRSSQSFRGVSQCLARMRATAMEGRRLQGGRL